MWHYGSLCLQSRHAFLCAASHSFVRLACVVLPKHFQLVFPAPHVRECGLFPDPWAYFRARCMVALCGGAARPLPLLPRLAGMVPSAPSHQTLRVTRLAFPMCACWRVKYGANNHVGRVMERVEMTKTAQHVPRYAKRQRGSFSVFSPCVFAAVSEGEILGAF